MKNIIIALLAILTAILIFGFAKKAIDRHFNQDVVVTYGEVELEDAYTFDAEGNRIKVVE